MTEKAEKKTAAAEVENLPDNWNTLPLEGKYNLVNGKHHKLADIDCDWDIDIKLQRVLQLHRMDRLEQRAGRGECQLQTLQVRPEKTGGIRKKLR